MAKTESDIFKTASAFSVSADILMTIGCGILNINHNEAVKPLACPTVISAIVLRALACEIYLKSIIAAKNKKLIKEHNLCMLFNSLDEQDRCYIRDYAIETYNQQGENYYVERFEEDLLKISNAFVDWRYYYEKSNSINLDFLKVFCMAAQKRRIH